MSPPQIFSRAAKRKQQHRLLVLPGWLAALLLSLGVLAGFVPGTRSAGALGALMSAGAVYGN